MAAFRSSTVGPPMLGGPPKPDEELKAHWQSKEEIAASIVALIFFMPFFDTPPALLQGRISESSLNERLEPIANLKDIGAGIESGDAEIAFARRAKTGAWGDDDLCLTEHLVEHFP